MLSCHIRGEGDNLVDSIREICSISQEIDLRLNISHFKATGVKNWDRLIHEAIAVLEKSGLDFSVDFYPYLGGSTTLLSLIPPTVVQESLAATLDWLARPAGQEQLRRELAKDQPGWDNLVAGIGWERVLLSSASSPENESWLGRSLAEIASARGVDPVQALCDLLTSEQGNVTIITMAMAQADMETIARLPWSMLVSDALYGGSGKPHPRLYGAFAKVIRELVFEKKILSLEDAIYKMTGLPARRHGLARRGQIKPGFYADLNIFDPAEFIDRADYTSPRQLATGMRQVLVNGQTAYADDQRENKVKNGRVLMRG
jgi:N-acyl-D-amino-acid deacylase